MAPPRSTAGARLALGCALLLSLTACLGGRPGSCSGVELAGPDAPPVAGPVSDGSETSAPTGAEDVGTSEESGARGAGSGGPRGAAAEGERGSDAASAGGGLDAVERRNAEEVGGAADERDGGQATLDVLFELVRAPEPRVRVHLALDGAPSGRTTLSVVDGWGGVREAGARLGELEVRGSDGTRRGVTRETPSRFVVVHEPGERLAASYAILPAPAAPRFEERDLYEPYTTAERMHVIGNQGILRPAHLAGDEPRPVTIAWSGFREAGWTVAHSFGGGEACGLVVPLDALGHALYTAGADLRVLERTVRGRPVHVAIHGKEWAFEDADFADLAATIVEVERGFFRDFDHPRFLVSVLPTAPRAPGSSSMGGTALTDTFALFLQPGAGIAPPASEGSRVPWLLAHEMFHDWNGGTIRMGGAEIEQYWFQEGFTNFYARRLLLRGGLIDAAEYVETLNRGLADYWLSPVREEPNARIAADFWTDPAVQNLPYARGEAVALYVDWAIRERSGGTWSLDDWMRALHDAARAGAAPVTTESLLADLERWVGPEVAAHVRAVVVDGALLELPPDVLAPCLALEEAEGALFDMGFAFEASKADGVVHEVREGSAAWAAGLRDGQPLVGWSVFGQDARSPVTLQVEIDGEPRELRYEPRGEPLALPRFRLAGDGLGAGCDVL